MPKGAKDCTCMCRYLTHTHTIYIMTHHMLSLGSTYVRECYLDVVRCFFTLQVLLVLKAPFDFRGPTDHINIRILISYSITTVYVVYGLCGIYANGSCTLQSSLS